MTDSITAIIVDDERDARDGLESLIDSFLPNIKIIAKSENAQNALEIIIDKRPEIIFLDIQMPVNDGFWLANKLNKLQNDISIIFVTAYDEYAIKAIKYAAFDFLTKPIDTQKLNETVNRYTINKQGYNLKQKVDSLNTFFQQDRLKFNTIYGFVMVFPEDIIYCEADKNYCNVYLTNGKKEVITLQLKYLEEKLDEKIFVKINRSILININLLETFNRKTKMVIISDVLQKYEFKASSSGAKLLSKL